MHIWRRVQANPGVQAWVAALSACLLLLAPAALAAPISPFVVAGAGVWRASGAEIIPEVFRSDVVGPVLVETGAVGTAHGRFRSALGSSGYDIAVTGGLDREVYGGSVWSDGFLLTGGSGTLRLSTHLVGSVAGRVEMDYALFVSAQPFDWQQLLEVVEPSDGFWEVQLPNAQRVLSTGIASGCGTVRPTDGCGHVAFENHQGAFDLSLMADVPFADGQTLYVLSVIAAGVMSTGGQQDFFNSASSGITVPAGITIASLSGQVYAAAVPEPQIWLLLCFGIAGMAPRRRCYRPAKAAACG